MAAPIAPATAFGSEREVTTTSKAEHDQRNVMTAKSTRISLMRVGLLKRRDDERSPWLWQCLERSKTVLPDSAEAPFSEMGRPLGVGPLLKQPRG